jgi:hypothetical protein
VRANDLVKQKEHALVDAEANEADQKEFLESLRDDPCARRRLGPALNRKHQRSRLPGVFNSHPPVTIDAADVSLDAVNDTTTP